jgi:hypothetical protein
MPAGNCKNPQPYQGADTGFEVCDTGFIHRFAVQACPKRKEMVPLECIGTLDGSFSGNCARDADCTAHANGACMRDDPSGGGVGCVCRYGCQSDADCGAGNVCLCGDQFSQCFPASCTSDADCTHGELCTMSAGPGTCPSAAPFACQTPDDSCSGNVDCQDGGGFLVCGYSQSRHECIPICVFGRPFLVRGTARTADMERRTDWQSSMLDPALDGLEAEEREALGREWARMGAMENASIAAFARFALQLLAVGAPASLVERTHEAMRDETQHAKMCFALASRYAGRPVGPGPLAVGDALSDLGREAILVTTILEGCIGETVAAVEAAEALARAQDPAVCQVLSKIAEDEMRHAELAWRYVRWATAHDEDLRALAAGVVASVVGEARAATPAPGSDSHDGLLRFGIVSETFRREIWARVLLDVVAPCARALLEVGSQRHRAPESERAMIRRGEALVFDGPDRLAAPPKRRARSARSLVVPSVEGGADQGRPSGGRAARGHRP